MYFEYCNVIGSSQRITAAKDSKSSFSGNEMGTSETYASNRVPTGPGSAAHDMYQGSSSHISGEYQTFDFDSNWK